MKQFSAPAGAIVRARFPESECVMRPGPKARPALVLDERVHHGHRQLLVAYGTSQHTHRIGFGCFVVKAGQARTLAKETLFDLNKITWWPATSEYFPTTGSEPLPRSLMRDFCKEAINAKLI